MTEMYEKEKKVLLVHNIVSPYRIPIFEELNKHYDLEVFFCRRKKASRNWSFSINGAGFRKKILRSFQVGPLVINYDTGFHLWGKQYDVVIVPDNTSNLLTSLILLLYSKVKASKLIVWSESVYSEFRSNRNPLEEVFSSFFSAIRRLIYFNADQIIAYSEKTRDYLESNGVGGDKITSGFQVMPKELLPESDDIEPDDKFAKKTVILSLGYLTKGKGVQDLIRAYKAADFDNCLLIIGGSGPYKEELESLAGGQDDILFVGYVEGKEKAKYYSVSDIFVLPTLHDPWGLVVNEAMYYGLPVIVTDAAGSAQLVRTAKNGFVYEPGLTDRLKSLLIKLVRDKDLRKKMSKRSKKLKEAQSVKSGAAPLRRSIDKVLQGK